MPIETLKLATRASRLALVQAHLAKTAILEAGIAAHVELVEIATTGDVKDDLSLENDGGPGLFIKEIENTVFNGDADIAVHSAKDLPSAETPGLTLAAYRPREDAGDILVRRADAKKLCFIATGSPRRRAQLKPQYPCAAWMELRGNVETRLKKIAAGKADATVLAAAGFNPLRIQQ